MKKTLYKIKKEEERGKEEEFMDVIENGRHTETQRIKTSHGETLNENLEGGRNCNAFIIHVSIIKKF